MKVRSPAQRQLIFPMQLPSHCRHDQVGLDAEEGQRQAQLERPLGHPQQERRAEVLRPFSSPKRRLVFHARAKII
jgi:hypothetical protein